jgi:hypothetical protein
VPRSSLIGDSRSPALLSDSAPASASRHDLSGSVGSRCAATIESAAWRRRDLPPRVGRPAVSVCGHGHGHTDTAHVEVQGADSGRGHAADTIPRTCGDAPMAQRERCLALATRRPLTDLRGCACASCATRRRDCLAISTTSEHERAATGAVPLVGPNDRKSCEEIERCNTGQCDDLPSLRPKVLISRTFGGLLRRRPRRVP